jgi:hypothetical protein
LVLELKLQMLSAAAHLMPSSLPQPCEARSSGTHLHISTQQRMAVTVGHVKAVVLHPPAALLWSG